MALEQGDALPTIQAENLVREHQVPLSIAPGLGIGPGGGVDRREQGHERHLVVGYGDGYLAALFGDVLRRGQVVAAHVEGLVKGGQLILPLLARIFFLPLTEGLHHYLAAHVEAPDAVQRVGDAVHVADVTVFVQTEVDQHRQTAALTLQPGVVRQPGQGQGEEQGTEEAVGAVLGGDNHEVGARLFARQQQVNVMVAGNRIHQLILENGQAVAQSNGDIPPEVFPGLEEQAVVPLGRVFRGQLGQGAVDLLDALVGQQLVHIPQPPLFDGQQLAVGVLQIADVVDEGHEQIQLRPAPEVVRLLGTGGVLNDGVGHRLHQLGLLIQGVQAVPAVRVGHVQEVHRPNAVTVVLEVGGHFFPKLGLRVRDKNGLPPLSTAQHKGDDKAPGLAAARGADAQQIVVVPGYHPVSDVGGVLVRVIRALFPLAQHHTFDLRGGAQLQKLPQLLFRQETGGAVGGIREDIKAPGVVNEFVPGEPYVPLFRDKADQQEDHNGKA